MYLTTGKRRDGCRRGVSSNRGWSQRQIAEALGVSEGAVSQWMTRARHGGADALRHRPPPGAPARLTRAQLARLPTLLQQGPEAYGFRGELWTRGRIAAVIRSGVWRLLPSLPMSAACAKRCAGAPKSPRGVPVSATKLPSPTGATRPGPRSKRGAGAAANDPVHRRIRVLSPAECGPDLCPGGPDAYPAGVVDA